MDKQSDLIDLGDAKEVTQGPFTLVEEEEHPVLIYREQP